MIIMAKKTRSPTPSPPRPQTMTTMSAKKIFVAFLGGNLLGASLMYSFNFNKSLYELDHLRQKIEIAAVVLPTWTTTTSTAAVVDAVAKKKKEKDHDEKEEEVVEEVDNNDEEEENGVAINNVIMDGAAAAAGGGGVRGGGETVTATATADTGTATREMKIEIEPEETLSTSKSESSLSTMEYNLHQIVYGRDFGYPKLAMKVLKQIWESDINNPYNVSKDILVFEHPLKTGGTSLSDVLNKINGGSGQEGSTNYNLGDGVLPGSRRSGNFFFNEYPEHVQQRLKQLAAANSTSTSTSSSAAAAVKMNVEEDLWRNIKAVYSHSFINSPKDDEPSTPSRLESFLKSNLPKTMVDEKRFRVMTIVRDPFPFVASNMNEWMCAGGPKLTMAINLLGDQQKQRAVLEEHGPCYGISWSQLYDTWLNRIVKPYCNKTLEQRQQIKRPPIKEVHTNCKDINEGTKLPSSSCQSIPIFLKSYKDGGMHDFSRKYVLPESYERHNNNNNNNSISIMNDDAVVEKEAKTAKAKATSDYEIDALKRLGGLTAQKDMYMMWIGITERMTESMCLFHSMVQYPYYKTPHARNKQCRPTSYYDAKDKQQLRSQEFLSYAVSNAAHAILDIRMVKLCSELHNNNNNNDHLGLTVETCCSNFIFDDQGRIQNYTPSLIQ